MVWHTLLYSYFKYYPHFFFSIIQHLYFCQMNHIWNYVTLKTINGNHKHCQRHKFHYYILKILNYYKKINTLHEVIYQSSFFQIYSFFLMDLEESHQQTKYMKNNNKIYPSLLRNWSTIYNNLVFVGIDFMGGIFQYRVNWKSNSLSKSKT